MELNDHIDQRDAIYKQKIKKHREGKQTKKTSLLLGDYVLVQQPKKNKWTTPYKPIFYTVNEIRGSQIIARRTTNGRTVCRDASQFKLVNSVMGIINEDELSEEEKLVIS